MVHGIANCEKCGIEFKWRTTQDRKPAKLCSAKCKFKWKTASKEDKLKRLKDSYEKKVIKKDGCWGWIGAKDKDGYGRLPCSHKMTERAHVASYLIYIGEIPEGMQVCHHCDIRECTNPEHLFLGTPKDNTQDMIKKGRWNGGIWNQLGSKNPSSKLNEEDVREIKIMILNGKKNKEISTKFNISIGTVSDIRRNRYWKHVEIFL